MKKDYFRSFIILLFLFCISGCVHLVGHHRTNSISDIKGIWESSNSGYHYLDIREDKSGYLISILDSEYYESYEIKDIVFNLGYFNMNLTSLDEKKEHVQLKGRLFGNDIVSLSSFKENEDDESLSFIRISKVRLLRDKARELTIEYEKSKT